MPHFLQLFQPSSIRPALARNLANSYSRLDTERGYFRRPMDYHGFSLEFWKIVANLPRFGATLFRTLIKARNAPRSAPFYSSPADMFCSEIWSGVIRDYLPKRAIFGDRWITRDFPQISENRGRSTKVCRVPILNSNHG